MEALQTAGRWRLQAIGYRVGLAALGWWVISEGEWAALGVGVPAVVAAVALSLVLAPPCRRYRVRPLGLVLFLGYFLTRSLAAGLDVAGRILHPRLPIDPVLVRVPLSLTDGAPNWLLASTLSLLPGTLSVALEEDALVLHSLNGSADTAQEVRAVERRVARIFGLERELEV